MGRRPALPGPSAALGRRRPGRLRRAPTVTCTPPAAGPRSPSPALPADHGSDPLLQPVAALTAQIAAVQQPGDIAGLARQLASIPLPVRVIEEREQALPAAGASGEDEQRTGASGWDLPA